MVFLTDTEIDNKARQAVEAAIVTLAACTYAVAFPTMYRAVGPGTSALAVLPVMLISWFWGLRVGVVASIMAGLLLNPVLLFRFAAITDVPTVLLHSTPYFVAVLIIAALTGALRDVRVRLVDLDQNHQRRQLEMERAGREQMEELLRLKSTLLNNMSHELRTPLTAILGFAEILSEEVGPEQREFARRIITSGMRLQDTLRSILDLAQLEGGTLEIQALPLDVGREVHLAASGHEAAASRKGLLLEIRTPDQRMESNLDAISLRRVVHCLVDNAIKFTDYGSVIVDVFGDGEDVHVRVTDTGIGIGEDFLPEMFTEFRQESIGHGRSYEGSGLGLAIARRLVELMGGRISVESRRGVGSVFTVSFARSRHAELRLPEHPVEESGSSDEHRRNGVPGRVLILDDNVDTLALTRHQLRGLFDVETVADADTALERAQRKTFDAFLLDINLGSGYDGVDVLRALRDLEPYRDVPIVAVTAYAMAADEQRILDAGFDALLSKPFTKKEITETIEHALRSRTAA